MKSSRLAGKMEEIHIRLATSEDAEVIDRLLTELEQTLGVRSEVKRKPGDVLRFGFSDRPLFEALIAWQGERPVGLVLYFSEFSTWRGKPGVYIQDLYVSAEVRGTGLGRQLLQALFERSRCWGATYCKLAVYHDNEPALSFYRHCGFQVSDKESVLIFDGL